jgi:hypothetical protein
MTPRIKGEISKRQKLYKLNDMVAWKQQSNRSLLRLQLRPGEPQEAYAKAEETATSIPHIVNSRVAER